MDSAEADDTHDSFGSDIGKRTTSWRRFLDWILVEADRLLIAAGVSAAAFAGFFVLEWVGVVSFVNDDSMTRLAGGMIAGTFSLVTLVVSINQLILSREFVAAGEAEERLQGVLATRDDAAEVTGVPEVPASPTRLLKLLVTGVDDRAETLADAVADVEDEELASQVTGYTDRVRQSADRIHETLEDTEFGTFRAVSASVGYDDAWQLYAARHLRGRYGDDLSPAAVEALDDLIETLELFGVVREHFKTTYLQRELTRFSQLTVYCGVPAILSAMALGLIYGGLGGATIRAEALPFVVSGLLAIVLSPLALLASFILRTTTVTRRTASIGPMLPQKDPDEGAFDVTYGDGSGESGESGESG